MKLITEEKERTFWVCFDIGNPHYLWWFRTRKEAREHFKKQKANPKFSQLQPPTKCMILDNSDFPKCTCGK